jgi:hypothetical protein
MKATRSSRQRIRTRFARSAVYAALAILAGAVFLAPSPARCGTRTAWAQAQAEVTTAMAQQCEAVSRTRMESVKTIVPPGRVMGPALVLRKTRLSGVGIPHQAR